MRARCSALAMLAGAAIVLIPAAAGAQPAPAAGADAVESYTQGTGSGAGYGVEYLPGNVLGFPDTAAREDIPTIAPQQVLGLGLGGEIVLRFDRAIVDGPGPDFTIFENAFRYTLGGKERIYAEPGAVAVSRDGEHFTGFPFDSLTLAGCAGVTPTNGDRDPADPEVSGGDRFDLATIDADSIRFVRIRDVTSIVKYNHEHPFWDMTLNGFDLDAVVGLHLAGTSAGVLEAASGKGSRAAVYPNPINATAVIALTLDRAAAVRARLVDPLGRDARLIAERTMGAGPNRIVLDAAGLAAGPYLVAIDIDGRPAVVLRVLVVH